MDVVSMCPLRAASFVWQPRPGVFVLTIACKATYRLEPGVSPLADAQEEVRARDACWDDNPSASVYAPGDLAPYKRCADVVLVGSAYAPGGPTRSLVATLEIGDVHKSIEVHADRAFSYDGRLLEGAAFTRMPLRWERAAGGPESTNPVGMRFDAPPNAEGRVPIPNLQPPWKQIAWPGDTFEPIGFGPIAPWWPARAWQLHRHLAGWSHDRWFERPLPPDVEPRYFNAAPSDQQLDALPADARLVLENLCAAHPRLVTNLARLRPLASVERPGRAAEPIELTPDTLWIDTDRAIATLTFRGSTSLSRADEAGRVVVTLVDEAPRRRPRTMTVEGTSVVQLPQSALPFVEKPAETLTGLPFRAGAQPAEERPKGGMSFVLGKASATALGIARLTPPSADIEEIEPEPESAPATPRRAAWGDEATATIDVDRLRREREALPFAGAPPPPSEGIGSGSPAFWQQLVGDARDDRDDEAPEPETLRPPQPAVAPPAFTAPALPSLGSFAIPENSAPIAEIAHRPPKPPEPEPKALPVETYATAKVASWQPDGGPRAALDEALRELGLDEDAYRAGEERLLEALANEAREGRATLARALRAALKQAAKRAS
jgi:hypothetical protein